MSGIQVGIGCEEKTMQIKDTRTKKQRRIDASALLTTASMAATFRHGGKMCAWHLENYDDVEDVWVTGCGDELLLPGTFITGKPWDFVYCPYCGNRIEVAA